MSLSAIRILFFSLISVSFQWSDLAPPKLASAEGFSVITYNVGNVNEAHPTPQQVLDVTADSLPDVFLLQEVWALEYADAFAEIFSKAAGKPVYRQYFQVGGGVAVLSTSPLTDTGLIPGTEVYGGGYALCELNGKRVLLCSMHLPFIPKERNENGEVSMGIGALSGTVLKEWTMESPRSRLMEQLLPWIAEYPAEAKIIAGDFNTIPFSRLQTVMHDGFSDSLYMKRDYLSSSYRKISIPFGTRADYIFSSEEVTAAESYVISESKGDHYPVYAFYRWVLP